MGYLGVSVARGFGGVVGKFGGGGSRWGLK